MLNKLLVLFFILGPVKLWAQRKDRVVKTDSSIIEIKYFDNLNSIRVFNNLKNQNKSYYTDYYNDVGKIREKGTFLNNNSYGVWREFWPNGKLKREIDYNKGAIINYDKKAYPFYDYQNSIKLIGDSIIKRIYSAEFFKKYIVWDIENSAIYNDPYSGNWIEKLELKPVDFLLRYKIKLDGKLFPEMIEFHLNSKGKFIPGKDVKGLEKLNVNMQKTFKLTLDKAITLAKQKGLVETSTNKADAFLVWEDNKSNSNYRGSFRVYVTLNTGSIKDLHHKGRSTVIDRYDVYVFNPWSANFVERKKVKTIRGWEQDSGSSSGLLADK